MLRDPLYRQIRRALRELKDGENFERCACDLLRQFYPSLAQREGGDDAGLDGLIANADRSSIQLICTTGQDVLGNLSRSIESNLKMGGKSHACILATSKGLTNPNKRHLEDRAKELERPLIQIYDQAALAQLLYRDPRWLKELLGLAGDTPPLSIFPITTRPLIDVSPVGRDEDIDRIANLAEDIVVVGQPGSGKTHLLFNAAKKGKGRFVIDEARVADGVRSIQPRFLIVDDAHSRVDFLKRLKLLRQQIHADFQIVASCWPGQEEKVCAALQTVMTKCHVLEGLPQKLIREVIHSQKIFGPDHLVAEIIHQSQGKPGLAVTLCRLCWESGSSRDVMLGTALARDIKLSLEPLLGPAAIHLLGCFAIGGDAGMSLEGVARLLDKNALEVRRTVEQLSAAGVLEISRESRISVHPLRLRQALVRDVFLKPPVLDLTPYLSEAPDFAAATRVLIEARLMGGILSNAKLQERLKDIAGTYEASAFEEYAHLGSIETEWILDNYPNKLKSVASVALNTSSAKTIGMLLDLAEVVFNERSTQGWAFSVDDVMPEIKRWILSANPNTNEPLERRTLLATSLENWYSKNRNLPIGVQAAALVVSIKHEATTTPPGEPMTMTIHFGVVPQNQLSGIATLWTTILPILRQAFPSQGSEIANLFHEWVHPNQPGKDVSAEYVKESRGHARQMMEDLLSAFIGKWTFHHHLRNYAVKLGLVDKIKLDPVAEILYPPRDFKDWEDEQIRCSAAADHLALELKDKDPVAVAALLTPFEEQARESNISHPSWGWRVALRIAEETDDPILWIRALRESGAPADLLRPFLEKMTAKQPSTEEIERLLDEDRPDRQALGVELVLKRSLPGTTLWKKGTPLFKNFTGLIEGCVLRNEIRNENLDTLLKHEDPKVAGMVAARMCGVRDAIEIPPDLFSTWKQAIVRYVDEEHEYVLARVFSRYPEIAYECIDYRLEGVRMGTRPFYFGLRSDQVLPAAIQVLTREQRLGLIGKIPKSSAVAELVRSLIGRDMELFLHLLSRKELELVRLDPLRMDFGTGIHSENTVQEFDEGWQRMAIAAMEHGFSEEEVFSSTQGGGYSWSGSMSSMFAAKAVPFEKLLQHPDNRLRKVGKIGFEQFSKLRDLHLAVEKRAEVRGENL